MLGVTGSGCRESPRSHRIERRTAQERHRRMRSVVTRVAVLLVGALIIGVALLSNVWLAQVGFAAGLPSAGPTGLAPTPAASVAPRPSPATAARPTLVPTPSLLPAPTATPTPPTPPPTPRPTATPPPLAPAPPPPDSEADDCPSPPRDVMPAPVLSHGDQRRKVVALTFDDGFDAENTRRILGILKRYHVNATFFPTGRAILAAPDVWRDVVAAGFPIGDHTFNHPRLSDLCYAAQLSELKRQANAVRSELGIRVQPYMRPPYEAWNRTTRIATRAAGQRAVVLWNIDTRDWAGSTVGTIRRRALHGDNGAIVLMHTTVENTAIALPDIIRGYRARGFEFVTIGEMLGLDGPVPYP